MIDEELITDLVNAYEERRNGGANVDAMRVAICDVFSADFLLVAPEIPRDEGDYAPIDEGALYHDEVDLVANEGEAATHVVRLLVVGTGYAAGYYVGGTDDPGDIVATVTDTEAEARAWREEELSGLEADDE